MLGFAKWTTGEDVQKTVEAHAGYATSFFMIGWAIGGVIFGVLGDRLGRARTMVLTIVVYSLFTGLSAFSVGFWDFAAYRLLTGLGGGGQFAVAVSLVAETMPERARPHALGWLQASSMIGNMLAAGIAITLGQLKTAGIIANSWRPMFFIGLFPRWSPSSSCAGSMNRSAGRQRQAPRTPRSSVHSANSSAIRAGGITPLSAWSWLLRGSSDCGRLGSSVTT